MKRTSEISSKLLELFKNKKAAALLTVCGITGLALIALSDIKPAAQTAESISQLDESVYNAQYAENLKQSLLAAVLSVDGAGRAEVYLTLERGVRYVYATEGTQRGDRAERSEGEYESSTESESSLVIIEGADGEEPLILEREEPSVLGVVVVCEGASDAFVQQAVIELAATLCGVGTNRVKVVQMKL